jgi:uncharacterized lipoprotein YddW (UPF0748 family)
MCNLIAACIWLFAACGLADPTTRPSLLEPGQSEARDRSAKIPLPTTWSHPETEIRGLWIATNEMLLPREQITAKLDALQQANFNVALIDTYFRGYIAYPGSKLLPQYPEFKNDDRVGWMIEQAHARGMQAHLWMEYGFYAYFSKDAANEKSMGPILDAHPDLLSVDFEGHKFIHRAFGDFYSLCPSNPKSHELLASIYAEAANKYPCDGVNLDRIRYADVTYCNCDYCKTASKLETGIELRQFPPASDEANTWLQWKRQRTLRAVETITKAIRRVKPNITITSYVLAPGEMDSKAQGWDLWMQHGLLDAVAVSMYGADIRPTAQRAIELLHGDKSKLISAISCEQPTDAYLTNVELSRALTPRGQFTWHLGTVSDDVERLKNGPYHEPATVKW